MRRRIERRRTRSPIGLVLMSWLIAAAWSGFTAPDELPEESWDVDALVEFLESLPGTEQKGHSLRQRPPDAKVAIRPVKKEPIELNRADSAQLEGLPFIGPTRAGRIIKFRSALGGFYAVEQLKELYGMDSLAYAVIFPHVTVDPTLVTPLCADTATWADLRRHPYIGEQGARAIERYRNVHGLHHLEELALHPPIGDSLVDRWKPYLRICLH